MDAPKPYEFIGFGAMDATTPDRDPDPSRGPGPYQDRVRVFWLQYVCPQRHSNTDPTSATRPGSASRSFPARKPYSMVCYG